MRRTKEQAAVTRTTILCAAEDLIVERGYDNVSLEQIAEAAGVKRGAVHFHFLNKIGVLVAICEKSRLPAQELVERLERERSAPLDAERSAPLDDLAEIIAETFRSFHDNERRKHIVRATMRIGSQLEEEGHAEIIAHTGHREQPYRSIVITRFGAS